MLKSKIKQKNEEKFCQNLHNLKYYIIFAAYFSLHYGYRKSFNSMLEELSFRNLYSFRDEVCLSFEATSDTMGEGTYAVSMPDGKRLLRFVLIYGANAAGKSNVLKALNFLREFVFATPDTIDAGTQVVPFRLDTDSLNKSSYIGARFYANGLRYHYELELDSKQVLLEKLSVYHSNQPTMLFERTNTDGTSAIKFNSSVVKLSQAARDEIALRCYRNMSLFAARGQVNIAIPLIDEAREWFRLALSKMINPDDRMFRKAQEMIEADDNVKKDLLSFIKYADFNVVDLQTNRVQVKLTDEVRDLFMKAGEKIPTFLSTNFVHKVTGENGEEYYTLPSNLQSRGTQRILGIESAIYSANTKSSVLPIDEIDSSLHPDLVEYLIYQFLRSDAQSQMIATTHSDSLLDTIDDLLRKDSIWFAEKQPNGNSELYSLVEYKGLNKI